MPRSKIEAEAKAVFPGTFAARDGQRIGFKVKQKVLSAPSPRYFSSLTMAPGESGIAAVEFACRTTDAASTRPVGHRPTASGLPRPP